MTGQDALNWIHDRPQYVILVFVLLAFLFRVLYSYLRNGALYLVALASVTAWAAFTHHYPYLFAFSLGFATAFAELVTKFSDEPLKAISTAEAFAYHLFNGLVGALALWFLANKGAKFDTPIDQAQAVAEAGLGSMLVLRSKLLNFKADGKDVSFGPDQLVKIFFDYMESAIDRVRSTSRVQFVKTRMDNIAFAAVREYTCTMLDAAQALPADKKTSLVAAINEIASDSRGTPQLQSYRLGFLLQNAMGEDFVTEIFCHKDTITAWQIAAPRQDSPSATTAVKQFFGQDDSVNYFAYGTNMAKEELARELHWKSDQVEKTLGPPRNAVLRNYRLVFNGKSDTAGVATANIEPAAEKVVEGVVYRMSQKVAGFLDHVEPGYQLQEFSVMVGTKAESVQAFVAQETIADGKPDRQYLEVLIGAGEARRLSERYVMELRAAAGSD